MGRHRRKQRHIGKPFTNQGRLLSALTIFEQPSKMEAEMFVIELKTIVVAVTIIASWLISLKIINKRIERK
jgi:hypothetical protein